jgi:hypothetical protein
MPPRSPGTEDACACDTPARARHVAAKFVTTTALAGIWRPGYGARGIAVP